jgi:hypothetical protein
MHSVGRMQSLGVLKEAVHALPTGHEYIWGGYTTELSAAGHGRFTLIPRGNDLWYLLDRRLGGGESVWTL